MIELDLLPENISGRQSCHLAVPGTDSAAQFSVVSFTATEKMGEPNIVQIELTHPQQLLRADFLSRDAVFSIKADDGTTRRFSGFIERFSTVQTTKDFTKYQIVLKSHFGRLEAVMNTGNYQHQSTPDILAAILRR
ncbi:late control gene D protein (GPD), partial [Paraburkholderia unamae]|uniref:contractile injection system protein, VgrG/Pvc8 family n=1 Tax=Paraburkholderia unamae TaxID=219649 RepID=UPI000DC233D6